MFKKIHVFQSRFNNYIHKKNLITNNYFKNKATESTTSHLEKLQNDITFVMEKIDSREKHLNNDLKNLIQQYRTVSLEVSQINNSIKENDVEKSSKEQELMSIINELETVKIQMEQRGNTMTDGSMFTYKFFILICLALEKNIQYQIFN